MSNIYTHKTQNYTQLFQLLDSLKAAANLLSSEQNEQLLVEIDSLCNYLPNPNFRVILFGCFNHGKSTLLNALLGSNTLPIDLIPTTGAAINIKYGNELNTHITFLDGTEINESGTGILKDFAILDRERRMRDDLASVEVFCPHSLLKNGVELVDLPGTNDREEQNNLVNNQLLTADLVIQVLDARKLFTFKEVENLRDWLIDRGIETVIFAVNFLNLLDSEEQQEVMQRARSIAEEFRASLPNNISNLYRVDALPALKARLKEDWQAAYNSGIVAFESALQDILTILSEQIHLIRLPRVVAIAERVKQSLSNRIRPLQAELERFDRSRSAEILKLKQTADDLKKSFQTGIEQLSDWRSPENLSDNYQSTAASALRENRFRAWEESQFKKALVERKRLIEQCIHQASKTFQKNQPERLYISFPADPEVNLPATPSTSSDPTARSVAMGTAIGWVLLGPIGGAIAGGLTHLANEGQKQQQQELWDEYYRKFSTAYSEAAEDYLRRFSDRALLQLRTYQERVENVFSFSIPEEPLDLTDRRERLKILTNALEKLEEEIQKY